MCIRDSAPTGQLTLYAKWEKIPDPKPEPKPEPEPEAPTYTLTVKGGTFTYNGGEAMTSALSLIHIFPVRCSAHCRARHRGAAHPHSADRGRAAESKADRLTPLR